MYRLIVFFTMQHFWIVSHDIVGDDFTMDKIFLQSEQAIEYGRRKATQNPDFRYMLYKQPITRTGKITFCKQLLPFNSKFKKQQDSEFNWDEFEAKRGADMDIDINQ